MALFIGDVSLKFEFCSLSLYVYSGYCSLSSIMMCCKLLCLESNKHPSERKFTTKCTGVCECVNITSICFLLYRVSVSKCKEIYHCVLMWEMFEQIGLYLCGFLFFNVLTIVDEIKLQTVYVPRVKDDKSYKMGFYISCRFVVLLFLAFSTHKKHAPSQKTVALVWFGMLSK